MLATRQLRKKDYDVWIMSELLTKAKALKELEINLDYASTTDEGCKYLRQTLLAQPSITSFKLSYHGNNSISDQGVFYLVQGLKELDELQSLTLCFCDAGSHVSDESAKLISSLIRDFPQLKEISFNFGDGANRITDQGMKILSEALATLEDLEFLEILLYHGENEITDKGLEYLSMTLSKTTKLRHLVLDFFEGKNKIKDAGFNQLYEAVKTLDKLEQIEIHVKGSGGKVSESLKKSMRMDLIKKNPDCHIDIA